MQFQKIGKRLAYLDELISKGGTGSPDHLAKRLGISRRMLFNYINYLEDDKGITISFCKVTGTYRYEEEKITELKSEK